MAKLRVFVSSTCYDLSVMRSELRPFITGLGHEPVMSDYSDILYDPRSHTHESCVKEIGNCDLVVLIIGARFGGKAVPAALSHLDFDAINKMSNKPIGEEEQQNISITQIEVLKAAELGVPVFAFVDQKVYHDHHVFEANKSNAEVLKQLQFPSIQNQDTAKYIFSFINFLGHRSINNSIFAFSRLEEIRTQLQSQWSQMFQRLLYEARSRGQEAKRYADFSEHIEDLKAILLASIDQPDLKEVGRGVIKYRRVVQFVMGFVEVDRINLLLSDLSWDELLQSVGIEHIVQDDARNGGLPGTFLILEDQTFYRARTSFRGLDQIRMDWDAFRSISPDNRKAIVDILSDDAEARRFSDLRYFREDITEYLTERTKRYPRNALASALGSSESDDSED